MVSDVEGTTSTKGKRRMEKETYAYATPIKIICAVCNRPIERLERTDDPTTLSVKFRAYCHGEMEEVIIHHMDICEGISIQGGVAFRNSPLLLDQSKRLCYDPGQGD